MPSDTLRGPQISSFYVLTSGDDQTGTGEESKPYRSFAKLPRHLTEADRIIIYVDDGVDSKAIQDYLHELVGGPSDVIVRVDDVGDPILSRLAAVNLYHVSSRSTTLERQQLATPLRTKSTLTFAPGIDRVSTPSPAIGGGLSPDLAVVYEVAQTIDGTRLTLTNTHLAFPLRLITPGGEPKDLTLSNLKYSIGLIGFDLTSLLASDIASLSLTACAVQRRYVASHGTSLAARGSIFAGLVDITDSAATYANCVLDRVEFGEIRAVACFYECAFLRCGQCVAKDGDLMVGNSVFQMSRGPAVSIRGGSANLHNLMISGESNGVMINDSPSATLSNIGGSVTEIAVVVEGTSTVALESVTMSGQKGDIYIEKYNNDRAMRWNEKRADGIDLLPLEEPIGDCAMVTLRASRDQQLTRSYLIPNPTIQLDCLDPISGHGRISYVAFEPCQEQDIEVAYFTDARPSGEGGGESRHYEILIDWGDGTTSPGNFGQSGIFPGTYRVSGKHAYKEIGAYDLSVVVADNLTFSREFSEPAASSTSEGATGEKWALRAPSAADCRLIRALNNKIASRCIVISPLHLTSRVRLRANLDSSDEIQLAIFTDARNAHSVHDADRANAYEVAVDWDRANSPSIGTCRIVALGDGVFAVRGAYRYDHPGRFDVRVSIRDKLSPSVAGTITTPLLVGTDDHVKVIQFFNQVLLTPAEHYRDVAAVALDCHDWRAMAQYMVDHNYTIKASNVQLISDLINGVLSPEDWLKLFPILETTYWNTFVGDGSRGLRFNNPNYAGAFGGSMGLFLQSGGDYPREWEPLLSRSEIADNTNNLLCGLSGTVISEHFSDSSGFGDIPMTHMFGNDYNVNVQPDYGYGNLLAINNFDIDRDTSNTFDQQEVDSEVHTAAQDAEAMNPDGYRGVLHVETPRGFLPTGGRPGSEDLLPSGLTVLDDSLLDFTTRKGDRAAIFGRWILDAAHDSYDNEIHPPLITTFGRVYDDGKYGAEKYTHTWLNSRPYLDSQHFGNKGHTLYGYLYDQLLDKGKSYAGNPAGTYPTPFDVRQRAIATAPYSQMDSSGVLFIHYVVRPPTQRRDARSELRTRFRFFVTVGTFVFVQDNGDDGVHVVIRIRNVVQQLCSAPPPASVKYNYRLANFARDDQQRAINTAVDTALQAYPGYIGDFIHASIDKGVDTYKCDPGRYPRKFIQYTLTHNDYLPDVDERVANLPPADNPPWNNEFTDNVLGNYKFVAGTSSYPCFGYLDVYWAPRGG